MEFKFVCGYACTHIRSPLCNTDLSVSKESYKQQSPWNCYASWAMLSEDSRTRLKL